MSTPPRPPLTTTTSLWPAASVLMGAVVMLAVFIGINAIFDSGVATTTTIPVVVGGLATGSPAALDGCHGTGFMPANISPALMLPVNNHATANAVIANQGAGDFDCHRGFVIDQSAGQLLGYYRAHLTANGWSLFSSGASNGAPQYLFQKAGTDGFYWIVGITVNATTPTTQWTYRIYQSSPSE